MRDGGRPPFFYSCRIKLTIKFWHTGLLFTKIFL